MHNVGFSSKPSSKPCTEPSRSGPSLDDACGGSTDRGGTWRRMATEKAVRGATGMEVQVVPPEMYDSARAKIAANLHWLFAKAFGIDDIPTDLQDPFYTDQYEQEHIKPPIIRLLLSAELYCRVCKPILQPEHAASLQSHQYVIQALSRKGIYVMDHNNTIVSELDLTSAPIKMSSHIHLIDALMMAYTVEMISIDKVVSSVKRFAKFSDSTEVPFDVEDAMVFWINQVNMHLKETALKELKMKQQLLESPGHQKARYRKDHLSGRPHQHFPLLDNLSNFVCNGSALLAVVHFYCPELIRIEDIYLKEAPSIADSLYNIQLLKEFSDEFLNKCFYLRPEDMLYSPPVLKKNIIECIAELFWIFEVVKPEFVQPRDIPQIKDVRLLMQPQRSQSYCSLSSATKHSFLALSNSRDSIATAQSPEISSRRGSNLSVLPRQQKEPKVVEDQIQEQRNRSISDTLGSGRQSGKFAWPGKRQRPFSQTVPYALHFPMEEDADSISLARSISKDSLASNSMSTAPEYMLGYRYPRRLSGHSLRDYIRFEDEEEEIEEEELVAIIDPTTLPRHQNLSASRVRNTQVSHCFDTEHSINKFYLEPLMAAVAKPAKEKSVCLNKEEECGESRGTFTARKITTCGSSAPQRTTLQSELKHTPSSRPESKSVISTHRANTQGTADSCQKQSHGFFLHLSEGPKGDSSFSSLEAGNDSDSDIENLTEDKEDELELMGDMMRAQGKCEIKGQVNFGEGESVKLGEDLKVSEWDDKEDVSGRSSPCLSTTSWSSCCSTSLGTGVKMTSFAEKKFLKLGLRDGFSSTSSTPKTTPDDSENAPCPPWQLTNSGSSCFVSGKNAVPSELLELHMQLEERRHAIEFHKKKMETQSVQQRLKLGKAAFLNVVKKEAGRSDTLPLPLKHKHSELKAAHRSELKTQSCRDDSCLEALKVKARQTESGQMFKDNKLFQNLGTGSNVNECSRSIEVLNEAIASIQQQMTQLSLQQHMLIKNSAMPPPESTQLQTDISTTLNTVSTPCSVSKSKAFVVNFENIGDSIENKYESNSLSSQCTPKFSSRQYKASGQKQNKQKKGYEERGEGLENRNSERSIVRNSTFRVCDDIDQQCVKENTGSLPVQSQTPVNSNNTAAKQDENCVDSEKEAVVDESTRMKIQLVEVDLSEIKEPLEQSSEDAESEQKNVLGYFLKDDERADEMEKRRAAFILKQQRKAEEARLRKQQQEVESELKRDETRRKAEEERIRKEEEKARRELIKQEYLRRKQEILIEEQGLVKPLPRTRSRKSRPKSLHRVKGSTTPDLSGSLQGSTLSLATEPESVVSVDSQRTESVCSVESFPVLSRASSRNMERDWENGSIASSITSTEYTGPKLFKEPSSKSNKPIIINAIAHCCLAGKVNETQKNALLEELDKCESNHLIILFRDGGCQFRAIYSYSPDTEEITKITGTGPRTISHKMVDKIYKYSSDRKQFTVIPAKSVSVSVDALTIYNHLWQIRRPGSARRK